MTTQITVNLVPPQKCFNDVAICRKGTYQLDDRNEGLFVMISVGMTIDNRGLTDDCKHVRKRKGRENKMMITNRIEYRNLLLFS